jgi:hypothetical protein
VRPGHVHRHTGRPVPRRVPRRRVRDRRRHHPPRPAAAPARVLGEIRDGEYRDLQYLYGAFAVSFRLLRPTRLQFRLTDAAGGTAVELQIDAHVRPVFLRSWALSQRLFWRRFETWTRRAVVG